MTTSPAHSGTAISGCPPRASSDPPPQRRVHLANYRRALLRHTFRVSLRKFFFENFAGDLEYHPRRAVLYIVLAAAAAAAFWFFSPAETKFNHHSARLRSRRPNARRQGHLSPSAFLRRPGPQSMRSRRPVRSREPQAATIPPGASHANSPGLWCRPPAALAPPECRHRHRPILDPFFATPLKRIGVDIRGNTIVAVLNDEPRPDWVRIFARQSVRAFVAGAEPANWKFNRREAAVDLHPQRLEGEAHSVLAHFDSYVENANALFREHLENVERLRQENLNRFLREGVEEEQRRQRILSSVGD
jgi:hypothetical protein